MACTGAGGSCVGSTGSGSSTVNRHITVVHGGAWDIPDGVVDAHVEGVTRACNVADAVLRGNGRAVDAVQAAIECMEDSGVFDAGRGSFINRDAEVEMDAMIASDDLKIGSVCAIQNVRHPIAAARLVRDKSPHVMLVGRGALLFAMEEGMQECKPEDLLVGRELERYLEIKSRAATYHAKSAFTHRTEPVDPDPNPANCPANATQAVNKGMDTVGCVCYDNFGNFAVGVSTGGIPFKRPGRVGDSPIWGCGGFTERGIGAVAATGYGEDLIRTMISRQVVENIRTGCTVQEACDKSIRYLGERVGGLGGVIACNSNSIGFSFNTPRMAYAYRTHAMTDTISGI
ncbi:peptidase T [Pelomyxa schiedti]|nr:peptidase T [Pelomyxa schiedti]